MYLEEFQKFGIFYFSVLDEVIVNRIIKIGKYEFVDIKKIVSEVINRIHLIISDFSFVSHELNLHDDISNRLDHLNKLSITRGRNISEIFKGSEINENECITCVPSNPPRVINIFNCQSLKFYYRPT